MKDPGDEDYQDAHDAHDDKTLLDELFGDATDATDDVADEGAEQGADAGAADFWDEPPEPMPRDHSAVPPARGAGSYTGAGAVTDTDSDAVALAEPGLSGPSGVRRLPAWQGLRWARSGGGPAAAPGCREIGLTTTGFVIFVIVDSIMMYAPFRTHSSTNLLPQAITLALLAFGLGALLIWSIRGACRPVGVGMMLGWVFMTLISAGYFTGLNP